MNHAHLVVEVLRGGEVESFHQVSAVVTGTDGQVVETFGDGEQKVFPRSAIKALQAIPFVDSQAVTKFSLDDRMVALSAASHRAQEVHLELVTEWLQKIDQSDEVFECGPAWPSDEAQREQWIRQGLKPNCSCHNCSGKHLGMISTCLAAGDSIKGYRLWSHPAQARVRRALSDVMGIDHETLKFGTDGCGIPTYATPLKNLARGLSALLRAEGASSLGKIRKAHQSHPVLIAGTQDCVTTTIQQTKGQCLLKSGAEGVYAGWAVEKGLSFALKVHDGNLRAASVAAVELLKKVGGMSDAEADSLGRFRTPGLTNSRGEVVGEIRLRKGS